MIQKLSHVTIYVLDADAAKKFYVETLGFELREDQNMGAFRWLTVSPPGQPDIQFVLIQPMASAMMSEEDANALLSLVKKGLIGVGVLITDDCKATYEELKEKGVSFKSPPADRPYGIEAVMKDNSGNWYSVVQRP